MATAATVPLHWLWADGVKRKAWRRYWLRDVLHGLNATVLHYLFKLGTIEACSAMGGALGPMVRGGYGAQAERVRHNIERIRPDLEADLDAAEQRFWENCGRTLAEFSIIDRLWTSSRTVLEGLEHIEAARASGRPRIYAGVHLSNWELMAPKLCDVGEDCITFYQVPPNRFRRALVERARRRYQARLLRSGPASALRAVRRLQSGSGVLVIQLDDEVGGRPRTPAFGRKVALDGNLGNAVRMALLTNALVLPAYVLREPGARFRLFVLPPIEMVRTGDRETDVRRNAKMLNGVIEPIVRRHLEQWIGLANLEFKG